MDPITLLMFAIFGVLIFMMVRKQRKTKATQEQQRSKLAPGVEMMTNFGLFGKVLSIDEDENKILLEISPGTTATVHRQTVAKIIEPKDPQETEVVVPEDASSLTLGLDKPEASAESADETLRRLNDENKKDN